MKVIPVLDILNGKIVHARGGKRNQYQPLKSSLFLSSYPLDAVNTFEKMGFNELYLADLDSIINNHTNFSLLEKIGYNSKIKLMVDAGVSNKELASQLFIKNVKKVIIGTETLTSIKFLKEAINFFGKNRIIVSLDLIDDRILHKFNFKKQHKPIHFLHTLEIFGVSEIIVLDLNRVGSEKGFNNQLIKKILEKTNFDVIIGGGIRDISDLNKLRELGAYGALIGTSLYSNAINVSDLKRNHFLFENSGQP